MVNACFCCVRLFFHTRPRDWLGERLQNDLFCVEWDVKPQLNQSTTVSCEGDTMMCYVVFRMVIACLCVALSCDVAGFFCNLQLFLSPVVSSVSNSELYVLFCLS